MEQSDSLAAELADEEEEEEQEEESEESDAFEDPKPLWPPEAELGQRSASLDSMIANSQLERSS